MAEMQYIPVKDIYPHPDNPRKDVGDVSELAASIKESGVLQNLTVVPAPEVSAGGYRVVIGHRRLAAAKQAGLETVPCVVSYMIYKQQVATMLAENMQRCDLTPIEQAQGIQMMLDLGEDIKGVSDKTGLSETTVRRRVKLMQLDQDALKAAESRGGTLADYAELEAIKDPERRNKVLKAIGTNNFRSVLATEKSAEERVVILDDAEEMLKAMGIEAAQERPETSNMAYVRNFGQWNKNRPFEMPEGDDPSNYCYTRGRLFAGANAKAAVYISDVEAGDQSLLKDLRTVDAAGVGQPGQPCGQRYVFAHRPRIGSGAIGKGVDTDDRKDVGGCALDIGLRRCVRDGH